MVDYLLTYMLFCHLKVKNNAMIKLMVLLSHLEVITYVTTRLTVLLISIICFDVRTEADNADNFGMLTMLTSLTMLTILMTRTMLITLVC